MKLKNGITKREFIGRVADAYSGRDDKMSITLGKVAVKWIKAMEWKIAWSKKLTAAQAQGILYGIDSSVSYDAFSSMLDVIREEWEYGEELYSAIYEPIPTRDDIKKALQAAFNCETDA